MRNTLHKEIMREAAVCGRMKPKQVFAAETDHLFERGPFGVCLRCGGERDKPIRHLTHRLSINNPGGRPHSIYSES